MRLLIPMGFMRVIAARLEAFFWLVEAKNR